MADTNEKSTENVSDYLMTIAPKDFFFDGMVLPVNVYLKIKPGVYLLIGKRGDKANFSALHSFNNPDASVFVKSVDNPKLINFVTELTSKVVTQKNVPESIKAKFISGLAEDAIAEMTKAGFTSTAQLERVSQLLVQLSQSAPAFDSVVKMLESLSGEESRHSMATCMISLVIYEEMDITLPSAHEKIAMAALLHDIGLKLLPKDLMKRPKHLWTAEDVALYEQHPIKSAEMLRDVKDLHSDVLQLIVEHHETSAGTGFPKRIRDVKISQPGKILALANCFANLIFNPLPDSKQYTPDEAIVYIENILGQPYNKQTFLALKNIINRKHLQEKL